MEFLDAIDLLAIIGVLTIIVIWYGIYVPLMKWLKGTEDENR